VKPLEEEVTDKNCEKCGMPMVVKRGRYGDFLACSGYPECKNTQSLNSNGSGKAIGFDQRPCGIRWITRTTGNQDDDAKT